MKKELLAGCESLTGRVALVTGAARGIGRAIALALADAGADVAVNFRVEATKADELAEEIRKRGRRALTVRADVSSEAMVKAMAETVNRELGSVDILIANAGIALRRSLEEIEVATFDRTLAVNLRGAFLVTSALLPAMRRRRWGRIVFIGSSAARLGGIIGPHYAASKAGLVGLMHGYARNLAAEGITVNVIEPALIATDMISDQETLRRMIPVGRLGRPEEVAAMVVATVMNGYLTGQTLAVNGGVCFS